MKTGFVGAMTAATLLTLGSVGCSRLPGNPGFRPETLRPDQKLGFTVLYKSNCSGCHGDNGLNGAALPLDNPVYLGWAGRENLIRIVANGVPQSAMLPFGRSGGGLLTDEQVEHIVDGMIAHWGKPGVLNNADRPNFAPMSKGDATQGKLAFQTYCARCHGVDGKAISPGVQQGDAIGSIVDPTYLALITDRGLRDIVVSGLPGEGMPAWCEDATGKPMTDQNVTDIVAWLASQRIQFPSQSFSKSR